MIYEIKKNIIIFKMYYCKKSSFSFITDLSRKATQPFIPEKYAVNIQNIHTTLGDSKIPPKPEESHIKDTHGCKSSLI